MHPTITHDLDEMQQARYSRETAESMHSTIAHSLDGMRQARYGRETAVKALIRQSLTT